MNIWTYWVNRTNIRTNSTHEMASSSNGSWETDLRDSVLTNFHLGIRANGKNMGRIDLYYVYKGGPSLKT